MTDALVLCVEGGGSRTSVSVANFATIVGPTTSVEILGRGSPTQALSSLLRSAIESAGVDPGAIAGIVVFHAAASTQARAEGYLNMVVDAAKEAQIHSMIVVTNDMVPLLYSKPSMNVVTLIAGTGTSAGGRRADGEFARVGGGDFVLSDQGGGFDIGMIGLRSVVKALDGRGPDSALVERAYGWSGAAAHARSAAEFIACSYETIYGPGMRTAVASFARLVVECAAEGDELSRVIVRDAVAELVDSVESVASKLRLDEYEVVLSGNLIGQSNFMGRALVENLSHIPAASISFHHSDSATAVLPFFMEDIRVASVTESLGRAFPFVACKFG